MLAGVGNLVEMKCAREAQDSARHDLSKAPMLVWAPFGKSWRRAVDRTLK